MEKLAPADHPIHDVLARRWSARAIDATKPVARETLLSLLEAARWAPSSSNEQPWRFLVFDDTVPEAREQARGILTGGNLAWAPRAPVLLLTVAHETFEKNGTPNRHALHDVGLATENLLLQAAAHGLVCHPMAGYEAEKARALFAIPEGWTSLAMIAIGHPGPLDVLPEKMRDRELLPRVRKPLAEIAFAGTWARPLDVGPPE